MRSKIWLTLVFLIVLPGCSKDFEPTRLPSGKEVMVSLVLRMDVSSGEALLVKYDTDLSIDDKPALRKEADEIWEEFKKYAEEDELKIGVVRATREDGFPFFKTARGHQLFFVKRDDGTWHCTEDDK